MTIVEPERPAQPAVSDQRLLLLPLQTDSCRKSICARPMKRERDFDFGLRGTFWTYRIESRFNPVHLRTQKGKDMPKQIHLIVAAMAFAVISTQTTPAEAQHLRSRQPLQAGFRWLGQGWSAGYHHRNPGPNTDYYNPYTAHNSMLISRMPGNQSGYNQYGYHSGLPTSSYPNYASGSSWGHGHGAQSIQPTFVPVDDDLDSEDDGDNDFETDDMPEVTSDPDEPGSIRVDEDSEENADFEESSFGDEDAFDDFDAESDAGSTTKEPGSSSKQSGSTTKATKTSFSTNAPGSLEDLDFQSFMVN